MTFANLFDLARPHRGALLLLMLLTLMESAAALLVPALAGHMVGGILTETVPPLGRVVSLLLAVLTLLAALRMVSGVLSGRATVSLLSELRTRVHDHLQVLPLSFHQRHTQGDLLALSTYEVGRLGSFLTTTLVALPSQLLTALGAVVLMSRIDPALALIAPVLVPAFYLALKVLGRRLRGLAQSIQEAEASVVAAASEDLSMLPATKAFTREDESNHRYHQRVAHARDVNVQETIIYAVLSPATNLIAGVGAVILVVLAGKSLQQGSMSPSDVVSLLLYAALLTRPVAELSHVYGRIQTARGTLVRLATILNTPPERSTDTPIRIDRASGSISFESVCFAYPGRDFTLKGVDLKIRAGETVALTGANGAGKSTMTSLLLRFEDPQHGIIRLDGNDLQHLALPDLRRQFGLVPQRPLLFDGTVRENIAFGRVGADDASIEAAARLSQAHDFISALPDGYGTLIGDHGVRLSGGQGQRLALARALLKDPPILILDEATSMYDLDGEDAFVTAAASALIGRTVILITHRPATLALANRVVTLADGQVIAERFAA